MKLQTTDKSEVDIFTGRGIPRSHYKINKSIKLHVLTDSNIDYFGLFIGFVDSKKNTVILPVIPSKFCLAAG